MERIEQEFVPFQGRCTVQFAEWLTNYLNQITNKKYLVFYDHGDSLNPNVGEIKGSVGELVPRRNELAHIDIMVATTNREIIALIEIEESAKSPKGYLASAFGALLCNNFTVRQERFKVVPRTNLIIGGIVKAKCDPERFKTIIAPQVCKFKGPEDTIDSANTIFEVNKDIESVIETLKERMKELFPATSG